MLAVPPDALWGHLMANKEQPVTVGDVRWRVTLARREDRPDDFPGVTRTIIPICEVFADIEPVGAQVFFNGQQLATPITHRVFMRWRGYDDLSMFNVIIRDIILPN